MIKYRVTFHNMHPIIFLSLRPHSACSTTTQNYQAGRPLLRGGPHQELLALLLFGGTKHLIVLQVTLQGLQPGLQELLRGGEKGDTVGRGFWKRPACLPGAAQEKGKETGLETA